MNNENKEFPKDDFGVIVQDNAKEIVDYLVSKGFENPRGFVAKDVDEGYYYVDKNGTSLRYSFEATTSKTFTLLQLKSLDKPKILPKYFIVKKDEASALWFKYVIWVNEIYNTHYNYLKFGYNYLGFVGTKVKGVYASDNIEDLINNHELITLEFWDEVVNKPKIYTCKDLSEGRVACVNDGTIEELRKVLGYCLPKDLTHSSLSWNCKYYIKNFLNVLQGCDSVNSRPTQSVKVFLKEIEEKEKPKEIKVGDFVRGFKFNNFDYELKMDEYIGRIGKVVDVGSVTIEIKFVDGVSFFYPKEQAIEHLANGDIEEFEKGLDANVREYDNHETPIEKAMRQEKENIHTLPHIIESPKEVPQKLYSVYMSLGKIRVIYIDQTDEDVDVLKKNNPNWFTMVIEQGNDKGIKIEVKPE